MSDGEHEDQKGLIHRSLAILSWPLRLLIRLYRSVLRQGKIQVRRLHRTIMDRRFWRVWFRRIKRVGLVTVKWIAFVIAFCIWPIGLLVLLYELIACLSPSLADLFPSLKDLFNRKADPNTDLFSRLRVNMVILTAWVGVFFLVWRTRIADKQTQINQESHYTELFTKAVEQLGAVREVPDKEPEPALEIRIGAIYSLERLAKDSERDYGPIIETLAAYIREHCRDPKSFDGKRLIGKKLKQERQKWIKSLSENPPAGRSDVAAALTVLSRRDKNRNWTSTSEDETQPDFTGANFQGVTLSGANLSSAVLRGVDLSGADLDKADLSGASLSGANLSGASLWEADLSGASLWEANLSGANLEGANLLGTNLSGANLSDVNLLIADLSDANLREADLSGTCLSGANLSGAELILANLSGAELILANLPNVSLIGADLSGASFIGVDVPGADFEGTLLVGIQLKDLGDLTDKMLEKAFGDGDTSLPNGLTRPVHWGSRVDAVKQHRAFLDRWDDLPF